MGAESRLATAVLGSYLKQTAEKLGLAAEKGVSQAVRQTPFVEQLTMGAPGGPIGAALPGSQVVGVVQNIPVVGSTLSSLPVSPGGWSSVARNAPKAAGWAARGLTSTGAGIAADVAVNQLQQAMAADRQQQRQQGVPYVTPRQQALYNSMFMAGMQGPGMYYAGM